MNLTLTDRESEYLTTVVQEHHKSLLHELNHVDTSQFEKKLRETISANEAILEKLSSDVRA